MIVRTERASHRRPGERGIALILTMLVLSILIVMITQFAWSSKVERTVARNARDDLKMLFAARGTVSLLKAYLRADRALKKPFDSKNEDWSDPAKYQSIHMGADGNAGVSLTIRGSDDPEDAGPADCERFLNVNLLASPNGKTFTAAVLGRLAEHLQIDNPQELAERIVDFVDPDSDGQYEAGARNAPLFHPDELLDIPELSVEQIQGLLGKPADPYTGDPAKKGLLQFLTTFGKKTININTVPLELFWAVLPDKDMGGVDVKRDEAVQELEEFRTSGGVPLSGSSAPAGGDFEKVQDLQAKVASLAKILAPPPSNGPNGIPARFLGVDAEDFRMIIEASCNGMTNKRYEVVLKRGKEEFNVLLWREVGK